MLFGWRGCSRNGGRFLILQARKPDQISNSAMAINAIRKMIFCILLLNELCAGNVRGDRAGLRWKSRWDQCGPVTDPARLRTP
jgi:hypothetical protein